MSNNTRGSIAVLLLVVIGAVAVFLLTTWALGTWAKSRVDASTRSGEALVIQKHYYPAYNTFLIAGKARVPMTYPRRWELCVELPQGSGCLDVTKATYNNVPLGAHVNVTYFIGKWTGVLYVQSIR